MIQDSGSGGRVGGPQVPEAHGLVAASGGEPVPIWAERDRTDQLLVAAKDHPAGLRGGGRQVPETHVAPRLASERDRAELIELLLRAWGDGRIKLAVTALVLAFRREHTELFAEGGYQPVEVIG